MTAQEAQVKAFKVNIILKNGQYADIKKIIAAAAESGKYEVWYYKTILQDVLQKLKSEGYVFSDGYEDQKGGYSIKINWHLTPPDTL